MCACTTPKHQGSFGALELIIVSGYFAKHLAVESRFIGHLNVNHLADGISEGLPMHKFLPIQSSNSMMGAFAEATNNTDSPPFVDKMSDGGESVFY